MELAALVAAIVIAGRDILGWRLKRSKLWSICRPQFI
jgi:hypothetical protein